MEHVATQLATWLRGLLPRAGSGSLQYQPRKPCRNTGDIATMLNLPKQPAVLSAGNGSDHARGDARRQPVGTGCERAGVS